MLTRYIPIAAFAVLTSSPAAAADFLIFDFHFVGTASTLSQAGPILTSKSGQTAGDFIFYLPTSFSLNNPSAYMNSGSGSTPYNDTYVSASSVDHYSLSDTLSVLVPRAPSRQINLFASIGPSINDSSFNIDPAKSFATYSYLLPTVFGGYSQTLSGTIDKLTITDGFGTADLGFVSAPQGPVPELTVWASLIAGLGLIGMLIRRRNRTTADLFTRIAAKQFSHPTSTFTTSGER